MMDAICFSFVQCYFLLVFSGRLSIGITSIGANLSAFRTFVRFALVLVLSVSSSSCCLGRIAACDCDTPWTFPSSFLVALVCIVSFFFFSALRESTMQSDFYFSKP